MTHDEARNILAMKGALLLLEEQEEVLQVAKHIHRHVERLNHIGSVGGPERTLLGLLRNADSMLGNMPTPTRACDAAIAERTRIAD